MLSNGVDWTGDALRKAVRAMVADDAGEQQYRSKWWGLVPGVVIVLAGLVAFNVWWSGRTGSAEVALGREVYSAHCASCHGANLEGQPNWQQALPTGGLPAPPHDASGHTWHHNDQSLFTTVKWGGAATAPEGFKSNMPAFGDRLSDREIWAVLAFIKSTWPPEIQEAQRRGHQ
jgi:mono/diheme cytochrome c family protein